MKMQIRFALIGEGPSDQPLVRILNSLCRDLIQHADIDGEWANPTLEMLETGKELATQLRALLNHDPTFNLIFVHRDADSNDDRLAREIIARGVQLSGCTTPSVPVVPIQETEAWLLLDEGAIRKHAGNPNGRHPLGLPKPKHVERRANPKELLRDALVQACAPGRKQRELRSGNEEFGRLRRRLFDDLDIHGPVTQLSAWQALVEDTKAALVALALSRPAP
jgi:hypothetical protein